MHIRIGTRGSKLAMVQAQYVQSRILKHFPGHTCEIAVISTKGDRIQNVALNQIGDKGLFVKEIEEQLLNGSIQLGVHSMKDMPSELPDGLMFTRTWKREDPRDALILRTARSLMELPGGAVIGTGSLRRAYQLKMLRPDLSIVDIRGNVDTRLRKMEEQQLDGIVLAAAGLNRLGMEKKITQYLEPEQMVPACAQGALALEIRAGETELLQMLDSLSDECSCRAVLAERTFLAKIGGSCHIPAGAVCREQDGMLWMRAVYGTEDGGRIAHTQVTGKDPVELGTRAAKLLKGKVHPGTVTLVGAGPGDAGLITVKGLQAIAQADCIIYDRLAGAELLGYAKADCELIYAGKENHHHTMKQEEINRLLVEKAEQYRNVVRLKGGDVYVFGRGGEEGIFLRDNGISFEIVPGISSSIAGPACAGIPITHRGVSTGFHVVTAHNKKDMLTDLDFGAMARGKDTLVFLMGLSRLEEIVQRLAAAGMDEQTPAAVIENATMPQQRVLTAPLSGIAEAVRTAGVVSPALIVVGEVVGLRDKLDCAGTKELAGKRYLVAKVGQECSPLTKKLREQGAFVQEVCTGRIRFLEHAFTPGQLDQSDWIVLTSKNGAEAFFAELKRLRADLRRLAGKKFAVVGKKTAKVLEEHGIYADLVPETFDSETLLRSLKNAVKEKETVLWGKPKTEEVLTLEQMGEFCSLISAELYENEACMAPELTELSYDNYCFGCASAVKRTLGGLAPELMKQLKEREERILSIGPKTSQALRDAGFGGFLEAGEATYEGMLEVLKRGCMI